MNVVFNGEPRSVAVRTTVAEFLAALKLTTKHVAVEVNLEIVPREKHASYVLQDNDQVEVVSLVGGG